MLALAVAVGAGLGRVAVSGSPVVLYFTLSIDLTVSYLQMTRTKLVVHRVVELGARYLHEEL